MSQASEALEHAEHAAHHGGHGGDHGKMVGLTMALLGVLLAFCAAQVGAARTELIKTMVEQTQAFAERQSQSAKHRTLYASIQQLRAISPTPSQIGDLHKKLDAVRATAKPEQAEALQGTLILGDGISDMIQPTPEPLAKLIGQTRKAGYKTKQAGQWFEAFKPAISAYNNQAEGFERAQLCAEIGIVLASIALLLSNRKAWLGAVALGLCCAGFLGYTFVTERPRAHAAEEAIEVAHHHYTESSSGSKEYAEEDADLRELTQGMSADLLRIASGGVPAPGEHDAHAPAGGHEHAPAGGHEPAPAHAPAGEHH
jgi:hypothetical protein